MRKTLHSNLQYCCTLQKFCSGIYIEISPSFWPQPSQKFNENRIDLNWHIAIDVSEIILKTKQRGVKTEL